MKPEEIIEHAARVICAVDHGDPDDLIGEYDEFGRFTTSEVAWTEYVAQARALSDAGLLARPLPTLDEIAEELSGWTIGDGYYKKRVSMDEAEDMAEVVLDLLKGQTDD